MFVKPEPISAQVPYPVMVKLAGSYIHDLYQSIDMHHKGMEFFEDDTSFFNIYFSRKDPDLKLFKVLIDWKKFATERKLHIPNLDQIANDIYEYLFVTPGQQTIDQELHRVYGTYLSKVFVAQHTEKLLTEITHLPCYSMYTAFKKLDCDAAEQFDIGKVYVVYEQGN